MSCNFVVSEAMDTSHCSFCGTRDVRIIRFSPESRVSPRPVNTICISCAKTLTACLDHEIARMGRDTK